MADLHSASTTLTLPFSEGGTERRIWADAHPIIRVQTRSGYFRVDLNNAHRLALGLCHPMGGDFETTLIRAVVEPEADGARRVSVRDCYGTKDLVLGRQEAFALAAQLAIAGSAIFARLAVLNERLSVEGGGQTSGDGVGLAASSAEAGSGLAQDGGPVDRVLRRATVVHDHRTVRPNDQRKDQPQGVQLGFDALKAVCNRLFGHAALPVGGFRLSTTQAGAK